ncbi:MAG TPA: hypothetical protein VGK74_26415 [Symbiobacteriaceae bacterium]|jgi:tetratricopeptide (TPR) repeat protein
MDELSELRRLYDERNLLDAWVLYGNPSGESAEWHLLGSLVAWRLNMIGPSRSAIEKALVLKPKGMLKAKCLFQAAEMGRLWGDYCQAERNFRRCLDLLALNSDEGQMLLGPCLYNLALTLESLKKPKQAVAFYRQALHEFQRQELNSYTRMCCQNLAWTLAETGELDSAHQMLDLAAPFCDTNEERWRQQIVAAFVRYKGDDLGGAVELCSRVQQDALRFEDQFPTDALIYLAAVQAEVFLAGGNLPSAVLLSKLALDLVSRHEGTTDARCFHYVMRVEAKVHTARSAVQKREEGRGERA